MLLGPVDALHDRAALWPFPKACAGDAAHAACATCRLRKLPIGFEYEQAPMTGPPISAPGKEFARHCDKGCDARLPEWGGIAGGLKVKVPAQEAVWPLKP